MKKIKKTMLVTGGAGFIGSHLCEDLLFRGFSVIAIDNLSTSSRQNISHLLKNPDFKFYKGSILDAALMARLIKKSTVIYHMAAAVGVKYILDHPLGSIITNLKGTETVLDLAYKLRKKIVIASTSEVYGKHVCEPFKEDDDRTLGPTSISRWGYAEAKAIDEFLALAYSKEHKLKVVIVRLFNVVGPRQVARYGMVLPRFVQQALNHDPLTVYGDGLQLRTFMYVKDATAAIIDLSLEKKAEKGIFNIGTDQTVSVNELALKVKEITHSNSEIKFIPYDQAYGDKAAEFQDMLCRIPDISKIKKLINYQPKYSLDAIIENTIKYFSEKQRIKK